MTRRILPLLAILPAFAIAEPLPDEAVTEIPTPEAVVETAETEPVPPATQPPEAQSEAVIKAALESVEGDASAEALQKEQADLLLQNSLAAEKFKKETTGLRTEVALLKLEREALTEQLALEELKRQALLQNDLRDFQVEKENLERKAELAEKKAQLLTNEVKSVQAESALATLELQAQIDQYEVRQKREIYADSKPQYLDNPLKGDGTLVISDRRIPLNGPITTQTADAITERINYFNNKNPKQPIFIVIDASPGGSVMAGYRILKAMEGSEAPVYVVVKSFAASMAAGITTLAEKSYAYPNAIILHHQISSTLFGGLNLTEQKELYEESQRWWTRLAEPIAKKMGITTDEFIKDMYEKSSSGDWMEFGDEAQKLKWVDQIVNRIHETSLLKNPDEVKPAPPAVTGLVEGEDEKGHAVMFLPRLTPKDVYFLYNPDQYYRLR